MDEAARQGASRRGKPFARDPRFNKLGSHALGEGAATEVWRATDTDANPYVPQRLVAVKLLKPKARKADWDRICREGGAERRFEHENVVRIFDLRGGERSPFLVMEYIAGEDLQRLLVRNGSLDPMRVIELATQLCAALRCLHTRLVHRDIKPANLMVVGDIDGVGPIQLKLIDLGIAVAHDEATYERAGTKPYMAPEVEAGEEATPASDVYGAGVVLYELATGTKLPALTSEDEDRLSLQELMARRRARPVRPPHEVDSALPDWLGEVIMRAVQVNPASRYLTAEEMARDIELRALSAADAPTTVMTSDSENEAPTTVLGSGALVEPIAVRLLGMLPVGLRERLPPDIAIEAPLLLLALLCGPLVISAVLLVIVIRVVATLCELPPWLLAAGVLTASGTVWLLSEETRRRDTAQVFAALGAALWRGLRATGRAGWRGLRASARGIATAATVARRWASTLPRPPAESEPDSERQPHQGERVHHGNAARRRTFEHGGRRRPRSARVKPLLCGARSHLVEVGAAARAWAPWLGRRTYLVVFVALAACLAIWLLPPLQSRVAKQPTDHRAVLTLLPAAVWLIVAVYAFLRLRVSKASPRRLCAIGLIFLVVLTGLGMALPSFSDWLGPRFWPTDGAEAAHAKEPTGRGSSAPDLHSRRRTTPREKARAASRRMIVRVRRVEGSWMLLLRGMRRDGWEVQPGTANTVRESADMHSSSLSHWRRLSQFNAARHAATRWSTSMARAATKLSSSNCHGFLVGQRGGSASC